MISGVEELVKMAPQGERITLFGHEILCEEIDSK
jgi:hypothetical protein